MVLGVIALIDAFLPRSYQLCTVNVLKHEIWYIRYSRTGMFWFKNGFPKEEPDVVTWKTNFIYSFITVEYYANQNDAALHLNHLRAYHKLRTERLLNSACQKKVRV
jgi:hypothetical protein